jgi:glutathione S-transferase
MDRSTKPIRLYRFALSGHSHRVELFFSLLGIQAELIDVDLSQGAHRTPEFMRKNSFAQVPVLEDGDLTLADSNAILVYLALRYDEAARWYPRDPIGAARVQRWLSVAAGELAMGPASARMIKLFKRALDPKFARAQSLQLLAALDAELSARAFLASATATIADIAMYTYTAHAPEGDIALDDYPNVRAWLARIEALPGFVPMKRIG